MQPCTLLLALGILVLSRPTQAITLTLTNTAYLDSRASGQTLNYGHALTVKTLVNNNVSGDGSVCRGLLQLPQQVWAYPPDQILSATVVFYVWQDNTGARDITLYPLTRPFAPGTGTGSSPADGATWLTYDGTNSWINPGGDFDPSHPVVGRKGDILDPDLNNRFFYWDITALLKATSTRSAFQTNGAILILDETPPPSSGSARAPLTSAYDSSYTSTYWPSVELTLAPPVLANVSVAGGTISFSISNLTVGATNTIERAFDLATNDWTAVSSFVATGSSTNWSEAIQPEWTNAFYRLQTQP